jgi:hypothetical protein
MFPIKMSPFKVSICIQVLLLVALTNALNVQINAYTPRQMADEFALKYNDTTIPSSLALFGKPPYGTELLGTVYYLTDPNAENEWERNSFLACNRLHPIPLDELDILNS